MNRSFAFYNNLLGWFAFAVAAITYLLTLEPTVSFWDCGEFIASAYKLEVGHPPGAPLFMLLARVFSLFSFGDASQAAVMINALSGLSSAFAVLFLYWTITHYAKKIVMRRTNELSQTQQIAILGSGLVGALAFAFSDTFWFSAVEAEVYAMSSMFTALVFWLMLKWENRADEPYANRWIILIAYLMGLSIGVHLLNLLTIPALVYVFYFRKFAVSKKGILLAGAAGVGILVFVQYIIIPGIPFFAAQFDLIFVNSFNLPFFSGVLFYLASLIGLLAYGIFYSIKKKNALLNTVFTALTVIVIGYSSFAVIVIRSFANPPMDENNPENMFSLLSYLNREQYGNRPLFYGQYYNAPIENYGQGGAVYSQLGDHYVVTDHKRDYEYDSDYMTFFPRMYSSSHASGYSTWAGVSGNAKEIPNFGQNLRYFFSYQIDHMYLRYFMWNFIGRQNDIQGHGGASKGNWITGIPFIDEIRTLPVENAPGWFAENAGRNKYYFLPFILGLIGLIFLYREDRRSFGIVFLFFLFTGVAIILYLNQTPFQPRERDYAYAGSFYVWGVFIGLGLFGLLEGLLQQKDEKNKVLVTVLTALGLFVPILMAAQNWDDHDRSGRYTTRDWAKNYLDSCEPKAILFTYGDNDTFPLWYAQEVEGYRTDVRVVNLSLLGTDWYIDQMKRKAYQSEPMPVKMPREKYVQGRRDVIPLYDRVGKYVELQQVMPFVLHDDQEAKLQMQSGEWYNYIPTKAFAIPVDSAKVVENKTALQPEKYAVVDTVQWRVANNYFTKSELAMLDMLANFNWERPVYFAVSIGVENMLGLKDYLRLEGFAYRLVPQKKVEADGEPGWIDTELLYNRLMNQFAWGRMNADDVLIDQQNIRTSKIIGIRNIFYRLAMALNKEGKHEKAVNVLDKIVELMPHDKFPYQTTMVDIADAYYAAGATEKADALTNRIWNIAEQEIKYFMNLPLQFGQSLDHEKNIALYVLQGLLETTEKHKRADLTHDFDTRLETLLGGEAVDEYN